ncbi:MAG: hypothetical protein Q8S11_08555 [Daejeonella sp.]|uniref:hypothetical protein n=1 Tax=Daejeonella sp. TaxID=2805397 RepID=UPI00273231B1|nr:hypothetical protein [Daejeonella sp.]MDP3468372.1 hypothetical protein [Daejeonella sp.]
MFRNLFKSLFNVPKQNPSKETVVVPNNQNNNQTSLKIWNQDSPVCPYCTTSLNAWPQRKRKCPNCKEEIYIKKDPTSNKWSIVTKQTLEVWEKLWQEKYFENRWLRHLEQFNVTRSDLERLKNLNKLSTRVEIPVKLTTLNRSKLTT